MVFLIIIRKRYRQALLLLFPLPDTCSLDQESEETIESAEEEIHNVLKRVDAVIRPLLMVKSMAHDGRLKNEDNNIFVSVINSEVRGCLRGIFK